MNRLILIQVQRLCSIRILYNVHNIHDNRPTDYDGQINEKNTKKIISVDLRLKKQIVITENHSQSSRNQSS